MEKYNSTLRSMQGYILEGKKFVELPKKEMGREDGEGLQLRMPQTAASTEVHTYYIHTHTAGGVAAFSFPCS